MDARWGDQLDQLTAPLNYLVPTADRPVAYAYAPPPGKPQRSGTYALHAVTIRDARPAAAALDLDQQGFALTRFATRVRDFYDPAEIRSIYYAEAERALLAATGATRAIVFDHNVRNRGKAAAGDSAAKEPVKRVHNDFTVASGPRRARDELAARGLDAERLLKGRYAIVNLWRPIKGPVRECPLAVCDGASIASKDWVATDLVYPDRVGETYSVAFNPGHRWFYFPDMAADEALLIKVYDSADDGRVRFAAHTAFDLPGTPPDAEPRESIEVRALVLFTPA